MLSVALVCVVALACVVALVMSLFIRRKLRAKETLGLRKNWLGRPLPAAGARLPRRLAG